MKKGKGNITINGKNIKNYFKMEKIKKKILKPLELVNMIEKVDIYVTVKGGGFSGQSESIRHGISCVLCKYNKMFSKTLRNHGYITRDSRIVERKKVGFRKSRKRIQYSKR